MMKLVRYLFIVVYFYILSTPAFAQSSLPAFPGAEGFGSDTPGGRGGQVIKVTNLNDSGTGSFRACATAAGPRICVFTVGGTIVLNSSIEIANPYLTIAGQTAAGDGITIKSVNDQTEAALKIKTHDVIVRYLRFRPGTVRQNLHVVGVNAGTTATGTAAAHNVIFDHVSISWGGDETLILYAQSHDITVQWSSISEALPAPQDGSVAIKGPVLGADNGPGMYTFHHNLLANNNQRNPNNDVAGVVDWVNNVVYNWQFSGANLKLASKTNLVNNYVKPGPNTNNNNPYIKLTEFTGGYFLSGNVVDGSVKSVPFAPGTGVGARYSAPNVTADTAQNAYNKVLADVGSSKGLNCDGTWFSRRDTVDTRIVQSVQDGTRGHNIPVAETFNQLGYISNPSDVGGWPVLASGTPCQDTDSDGMPNVWETVQGLSTSVNDSASDKDGDGYTNIEEYINGTISGNTSPTPTRTPTPIISNSPTPVVSSLKAFPGAEGFGSDTPGGRGGQVIKVTNLNDSGTGSLRACAQATGPRTCVFTVAGTIVLNSTLNINSDATIAGQTAPRGGITLKKDPSVSSNMLKFTGNNIIIRYIRMRPGPSSASNGNIDGLTTVGHHIVLDHISLSWSVDEGINSWTDSATLTSHDITLQRSIIAEGLHHSVHADDVDASQGGHSKGGLFGQNNSHSFSIHHNLIANNADRNLKFTTGGTSSPNPAIIDFVNNVVYNFGYKATYVRDEFGNSGINFVNNYLLQGPSTGIKRKLGETTAANGVADLERESVSAANTIRAYVSGNVRMVNSTQSQAIKVDTEVAQTATRFTAPQITTLASQAFYNSLITPPTSDIGTIADVGANRGLDANGNFYARPDAVDKRILAEMKQGMGKIIDCVSPNGYTWRSPANTLGNAIDATIVRCNDTTIKGPRVVLTTSSYTSVGVNDPLYSSGVLEGWPILDDAATFPHAVYADTDNDGMADTWETNHFGNLSRGSATASTSDFDSDGYTDLEEFLNATNPKVAEGTPPMPGDVNGDNHVTLADLAIVLSNFGKTGVRTDGNIAGTDNAINLLDLSTLLANFGS